MNVLRVVTAFLLVAFFVFTFIYVLPTNPIQRTLKPFLDATIGTYFDQDWELFAPDPVDSDYAVLVRPLTNEELKIAKTRGVPNNGWYDVSSPLWTKLQNNRFSAYGTFSNAITNAASSYDYDPQQEPLRVMVRFASAFCKDIGRSDANYIALMIRERQSSPWPEGKVPKPRAVKTVFVGVYQIDRSVENIHLYQR
jgi:hypothetical protein